MDDREPQFLEVGDGPERRRIAYRFADTEGAGSLALLWIPGFLSDMASIKALAVAEWARARGLPMLRFDYSGHGLSDGSLLQASIGDWLNEALAMLSLIGERRTIVVGSSMGGWIALLLARHLARTGGSERLAGLVLIAPAWDMTELMWSKLPTSARAAITDTGAYLRPSRYGDGPYPITRTLIEDGRRHLIGSAAFDPGRPLHILHGLQDPDVPWEHTLDLVAHLSGDWARVTAIPDGEHRLSRPQDLALLLEVVAELAAA